MLILFDEVDGQIGLAGLLRPTQAPIPEDRRLVTGFFQVTGDGGLIRRQHHAIARHTARERKTPGD